MITKSLNFPVYPNHKCKITVKLSDEGEADLVSRGIDADKLCKDMLSKAVLYDPERSELYGRYVSIGEKL